MSSGCACAHEGAVDWVRFPRPSRRTPPCRLPSSLVVVTPTPCADAETIPSPPSRAQIRLYFADCVYTTADAVGFYFGLASIACWLVAQVPQFVQNFRLKSAEGLSPWFLAEWLMGDTFNLLGCLMTGDQLQTEVYTAVYFMCVDMLMIFQFVYYTLLRREALGLITADMRDPESALSRRPLLADAAEDDASDASDETDASDDDVATVAGSVPADGFRVRPDPVDRLASPPPREPGRPRPRGTSPTRRPASRVAALAAASVAIVTVVAVVSSNPAASDEFRFARLRRAGLLARAWTRRESKRRRSSTRNRARVLSSHRSSDRRPRRRPRTFRGAASRSIHRGRCTSVARRLRLLRVLPRLAPFADLQEPDAPIVRGIEHGDVRRRRRGEHALRRRHPPPRGIVGARRGQRAVVIGESRNGGAGHDHTVAVAVVRGRARRGRGRRRGRRRGRKAGWME